MSFIEEEEKYWLDIIESCGYNVDKVILNVSSRKDLGDYQYNGAMKLASIYKKKPVEIAKTIVDRLSIDNRYIDINIAGPGFINFRFREDALVEYFNKLNKNIEENYYNDNPKTIFLDYGGANVAKALHVGHLRSANIGEALKRLAKALNNKTISDAHLGDYGRPIGLVMTEIKHRYPDLPYFDKDFKGEYPKLSLTNKDLMEIYPCASNKAKEDEEYLEEARNMTMLLQNKEEHIMALWDAIMDISKKDIKRVYERLNTTFDLWEGEADCSNYISEVSEYLNKKNILKISEGAKVIYVNKDDDTHTIPPLLYEKSNGSASYETTDLAGIWERVKLYNPDEIWYLADARQALHFEQVFRAAYLSGIATDKNKLLFIPFGTMNGRDGKPFKTRDGGVMELESLLDMVIRECEPKILPNIVGEERERIAEIMGVAAVKYADLIPEVSKDYNFDPVKFSDINGKTGPYLLYSTIRMKSLLNKSKMEYKTYHKISTNIEREIILLTTEIRNILISSLNNKTLNDITDYLYKITNLYNNFYSTYKVLIEEDLDKKESWLVLTKVIYDNNCKLLNILGIDIPDKL